MTKKKHPLQSKYEEDRHIHELLNPQIQTNQKAEPNVDGQTAIRLRETEGLPEGKIPNGGFNAW